ncbi:trehalose-phosphatase [Candidatus Hecatella orcuttiae]|jgi:trehalose-phosphatase|uniref:trehalose-phosphatase n=1 Tax=Candidatus Hecatella orcuttiae TaxID=1935119 RepID=UPI002867B7F9|nr:trehalose-phosphatase [Candidatus Hecatella orcuttiae]
MRYLFAHWPDVEKLIKTRGRAVILSDYDGTLTPIVDRPELALLPEKMRRLLNSLAHHPHFTLAIITGRALEDIKKLVGVKGVYYAGNHGLEIEGPGLTLRHPSALAARPVIAQICRELRSRLSRVPGVMVEDKGLSASLHYRLVSREKIPSVKRALLQVTRGFGEVKITEGKKVFEIRPDVAWDKGAAVRWLLKAMKNSGFPIYLGDDQTDEDAFKALDDGVTILVAARRRPSKAKFFVRGVPEVQEFFRRLAGL